VGLGYSGLFVIKKIVNVCKAPANKWEAPLNGRWWSLMMSSKVRAAICMMGRRVSAFLARRSSDKIFLPPTFSLLHLKRCVGFAKLQSGHLYFNCIEFDLFIF
jgi:hypothetical protein